MRKCAMPIWSTRKSAVALGTIIAVTFAGAPAARAATTSRAAAESRLVVTSSADAGPATLRAALDIARTRPGADTIALATKKPIRLRAALPAITDAVTITGTGNEIVGPGAGTGFVVRSNDVTIKGLTLRGFTTGIRIERASRVTITGNLIRDNRGAGVTIVGPTKKQVAAALASHTLSLPELVALVPTHVVVRDNRIGPNAGPAVARSQDGIVHVAGLTDDGRVARGSVALASGATTVELFASPACPGAQPQAETRLGTAKVTGKGAFSFAHAPGVGAITAIATDDMGGSSAVSACARRVAPATPKTPAPAKPAATTTTTTVAPTTTTTIAAAAPRVASRRPALSIPSARSSAAAATASDCTTTFDGANLSSAWSDPLNWNPVGVPGPTSVACIPSNFGVAISSGNSTVGAVVADGSLFLTGGQLTIAQESTIAALTIAGGFLEIDAPTTVTTSFGWTTGVLVGPGELDLAATASATWSSGGTKSLSTPIVNNGTIDWTGGQLQVRSDLGGIANITNNKTFNISSDNYISWCCGSIRPTLTNSATGTITKTGTGNLIFNNIAVTNDGTIDHQAGTITFQNPNDVTQTLDGTLDGGIGATVTFAGGDWTITHKLLTGTLNVTNGTLHAASTATSAALTINLTGGTLDVNTPDNGFSVFNLTIAGGTLSGTTNIEPLTSATWTTGAVTGPGTMTIDDTVTLTMSSGGTKSLSTPIVNNGTIDWTGGQLQVRSDLGGIANITNNKTFNISSDNYISWCCGSIRPTLTNSATGTITKTGTGNLIFNNIAVTNDGTIDHQAGTITFQNPNDVTQTLDGTLDGGIGATVTFAGGDWTITHKLLTGTLNVTNGTLHAASTATSAALTINLTGGTLDANTPDNGFSVFNLTIAGGTLSGTTNIEPLTSATWTTGAVTGPGTMTIDDTVTLTMSSGGTKSLSTPIVNNGTIDWTGGQLQVRSDLGGIANITNNKTFNISSDNYISWCCGSIRPTLTNSATGTITKTGTGNLIFNNIAVTNDGTIDHQAGTITFQNPNDVTQTLDGTLDGGIGATVTFAGGDWTITHKLLTGTLNVTNGTLHAASTATSAALTINLTGGTLDANTPDNGFSVFNLTIAGGTLSGTTNIEPLTSATWTTGAVTGPGTMTIDDTVTLTMSSGGTKSLSTPIVNNGTIDWTGGQLQVRSDLGGIANITNNKTFNISSDNYISWCCGSIRPTLTNSATGTITKTGTGNLIFNNIAVTNDGTIDHQAGTITFQNPNDVTQTLDGTLDGGIGATVTFAGGDWTITHKLLTGTLNVTNGTLHAASTATSAALTINLTGGTLDANTPDNGFSVFNLTIAGGTLSGTTNIEPLTSATWTTGAVTGPGTMTIDDTVTLTMSSGGTKSLSTPIVNNGTIDWTGGQLQVRSDLGGIANITNNKTFNISSDNYISWCCGPNRPFVKNTANGHIVRSGGGTTIVQGPSFENKGTLEVAAGTMSFNTPLVDLSGGALTAGTWNVGADATLDINGADLTGNAAHIALQGTGARIADGSNNNALRHLATNDGSLELSGGAALSVGGDLDNRGTITLGAPDTLTVAGAFTQHPNSRLNVAIAESSIPGFDFSLLTVGGKATLAGTLGITTVAPFVPTDQTFRIIDATTLVGTFSTLAGADLGSGVAYSPLYDSGAGDASLTVNGVATVDFNSIAATTEFNGTIDVPFTLSHAMSVPVQVTYHTEAGTATADVDYSEVISAVVVPAGATTGVATVPILDDNLPERDETFSIVITKVDALGVPVRIGQDTQEVTIVDDDGPIPSVEIADTAISEGDVNLPVDVSIDRALPVDMQVSFTTQPGTATENVDYDATTGTVTIPAGQTVAEAIIPIHEDSTLEPDETFTVHITGATSESAFDITDPDALVTIVNDDTAAPPTIVMVPETINEGVGQYALHINGVGGDTAITVPITFADLTAKSPADYQRPGVTTVTIAPNGITTVLIPIVDDALDEADEVFAVDVGGTTAQFTIADNDPRPRAVIDDTDVVEGNSGTTNAVFTIRLVDSLGFGVPTPSGQSVQVEATTVAGTATEGSDFQPIATIVTIPAGATSATVSVPVVGDTLDEGSENFTVHLGAVLNADVDPNTFATGTIIDDDTPAGTGDVPGQLQQGSQTLLASLPNWGSAFDLDSSAGFETPVVTDQLASRLGTASALSHGVPALMPTPATDLAALLAQAHANGATVDWAEGGLGGSPTPPTANDFVQLRYTTTLANLAEAAGFTGDEFNDQTAGVLQGIASALGLDASLTISGDLAVTLVFGVDSGGFYVAPETSLRLTVAANGSVAGTATLSGASGVSISGTGDANLTVTMQLGSRKRVADLSGDPHTLLHPRATGVAHMQLTAARDPLALTWSSTHTVTTDGTNTTDSTSATLDGSLTLPSLAVTLHGTYDGSTWHLTGTGAAATINGFTLDHLAGNATITPTSFDGSLDAVAHLDLGNGNPAPSGSLHATFNGAALHASVHVDVPDQAVVIGSATLQLHTAGIDATFDADVDAQTISLGVKVHAATVSGAIHGALSFSLDNVDLTLGTDETGPVLSVAQTTASLTALGGVTVTLVGFHVNRDGTFGATSIAVHADALLQGLGLAGILPFDLTDVALTFPNHEDLDNFTAQIGGSFDTSAFSALPFTPVIGIGCDPLRTSCPAQPHFSFAVAVDSLAGGDIALEETQPITLGFANLPVGVATISADLTLGHYHLGHWVDEFGGTLEIGGISPTIGNAGITVKPGGLDVAGHALNIAGEFDISAKLGDHVEIDNAALSFSLGLHFAHGFTFTGPTLDGLRVETVKVGIGDFLTLTGSNVDLHFAPAPGQYFAQFGALGVQFDQGAAALANWSASAGNFALDAHLAPVFLTNFFLQITPPPGEHFGLPDYVPFHLDSVKIAFPGIDPAHPPTSLSLDDLADFSLTVSGGIDATAQWPISASVQGLEINFAKLARGEFPITNLQGLSMGVQPFELAPGFKIGGFLAFGTVDVDADPGPAVSTQTVFYGRVGGTFEFDGVGAGIDLVVSEYGPVLASVEVPLGIPLDGGTLGGIILANVKGGVAFGGRPLPDPQRPLDIIHDPAFNTDFPVTLQTIHDAVQPAVQTHTYTWHNGFTLTLSGTIVHALAPGVVSGHVTIGANIGLIPGQSGLKLIGHGDISVWGMPFAGAAVLINLQDPVQPKFDLAFETPQVGNPLGFLLPAQTTFEVSLDTKGILPGFGLGVRTFLTQITQGGLAVGQSFFSTTLDQLAASLQHDHSRPLAQLLLDTNRNGSVSTAENAQTITRTFLVNGVLGRLALGANGLPANATAAGQMAQTFAFELLDAAGHVTGFDLSAANTNADTQAFANILGRGGEAIAAMLGVTSKAVHNAGAAFFSQFDPTFSLKGAIQPVILGIPFGAPDHDVTLLINKTGLSFGFDTSITNIGKQLANMILPFAGGAILTAMTLGFEDHLGLTFQLPITGVIEGLFGGPGLPAIDPLNGNWAVQVTGGMKFLGFDIGQMTGLVIGPNNPTFVDAHVQRVYLNPAAPLDPTRIPIATAAHYNALITYGGVLLSGRLLLPKLLTDPVALLSSLNLPVPANVLDVPNWVAAMSTNLTQLAQPARMQLFIPGFSSLLNFNFNAPTNAQRIAPKTAGAPLATQANALFRRGLHRGNRRRHVAEHADGRSVGARPGRQGGRHRPDPGDRAHRHVHPRHEPHRVAARERAPAARIGDRQHHCGERQRGAPQVRPPGARRPGHGQRDVPRRLPRLQHDVDRCPAASGRARARDESQPSAGRHERALRHGGDHRGQRHRSCRSDLVPAAPGCDVDQRNGRIHQGRERVLRFDRRRGSVAALARGRDRGDLRVGHRHLQLARSGHVVDHRQRHDLRPQRHLQRLRHAHRRHPEAAAEELPRHRHDRLRERDDQRGRDRQPARARRSRRARHRRRAVPSRRCDRHRCRQPARSHRHQHPEHRRRPGEKGHHERDHHRRPTRPHRRHLRAGRRRTLQQGLQERHGRRGPTRPHRHQCRQHRRRLVQEGHHQPDDDRRSARPHRGQLPPSGRRPLQQGRCRHQHDRGSAAPDRDQLCEHRRCPVPEGHDERHDDRCEAHPRGGLVPPGDRGAAGRDRRIDEQHLRCTPGRGRELHADRRRAAIAAQSRAHRGAHAVATPRRGPQLDHHRRGERVQRIADDTDRRPRRPRLRSSRDHERVLQPGRLLVQPARIRRS